MRKANWLMRLAPVAAANTSADTQQTNVRTDTASPAHHRAGRPVGAIRGLLAARPRESPPFHLVAWPRYGLAVGSLLAFGRRCRLSSPCQALRT